MEFATEDNSQITIGPLVSIIVITYNSSKYVIETLESAKAQTYQNVELIVSDDCSTDDTIKICGEWIEKNKNRFIKAKLIESEKNTGISANCNRGLKPAKGEWLKFIAGDDILLENCIEVSVSYSVVHKAPICTSALIEFSDESDNQPNRLDQYCHSEQRKFFSREIKDQYKYYLRDPIFLNTPAWMFNKIVFNTIGAFDESIRMLEDQPFLLKALRAGFNIYYIDKPTVRYRTSPKSDQRITGQIADYYLAFDQYRFPYLKRSNPNDLMVLYDYFLYFKLKHTKHTVVKLLCRLLLNATDPIYIKKKWKI